MDIMSQKSMIRLQMLQLTCFLCHYEAYYNVVLGKHNLKCQVYLVFVKKMNEN